MVNIPTYEEAEQRINEKRATALDHFIVSNEPAGVEEELQFRTKLTDMLAEVEFNAKWHTMATLKPTIKVGDKVKIKSNLRAELSRLRFIPTAIDKTVDRWQGKTLEALDVYIDKDNGTNEYFVTVELCVEIPINCCELVKVK